MVDRRKAMGLVLATVSVGLMGCRSEPRSTADGIYAPSPSPERLAHTDAAKAGASVRVVIAFCVDERAETVDVEVAESSGDAGVDAICLETVQTWKFRAYVEDGLPKKKCGSETFNLRFV